MDFSGGAILLPYLKLMSKTLYWSKCSLDVCPLKADTQSNDEYRKLTSDPYCQDVFRNLFYDGMWQIPVKGMYWNHSHTELWANATWYKRTTFFISRLTTTNFEFKIFCETHVIL